MKKKWRDYVGRFMVRIILLIIGLLLIVFVKSPYINAFTWGMSIVIICEGAVEAIIAKHNIKLISEDK